eukprot:7141841-Pyramimonas_sp.AAC.1
MGWPSSSFAEHMDYIVVDKVVAPPHLLLQYYSEKVLYMPHSYYLNDHRRSAAADKGDEGEEPRYQTRQPA